MQCARLNVVMMKPYVPWMLGLVCVAGIVNTLTAQTSPNLAFDAASIKPNNSTSLGRRFGVPGDRFVATNETLWQLITVAYGAPGLLPQPLAGYQISGGPKWINSDRFDVEAKAAGDVVSGTEGTRRKQLMLQTLLAQRFKLAVHHEMKDMPVYALVLARRDRRLGPQLRRSQVDRAALRGNPTNPPIPLPTFGTPACDAAGGAGCSPGLGIGGVFKGGAMTLTELTVFFSRWLDRTVLDRTGLAAAFDVEFQFSSEGLPGTPTGPPGVERPPSDGPSIFTAVQEQLGLKLESTSGPVDVLIIDHAEKPSED
jgi:uncharacterized protein (TIGR03435 family)